MFVQLLKEFMGRKAGERIDVGDADTNHLISTRTDLDHQGRNARASRVSPLGLATLRIGINPALIIHSDSDNSWITVDFDPDRMTKAKDCVDVRASSRGVTRTAVARHRAGQCKVARWRG